MARTDHIGAQPYRPEQLSQPALIQAVQGCRGCDLYEHATQAVFGAGGESARLMLVGEPPGDVEDRPAAGVGEQRGQRVDLPARPDVWSLATIHPSALLRAENRDELFEGFVADLRTAAELP